MASVKIKFLLRNGKSEGYIIYQIIHERRVRCINTGLRMRISAWDNGRSLPKSQGLRETVCKGAERLRRIIRKFEYKGADYSVSDIVDSYAAYSIQCSLTVFMNSVIAKLKNSGKMRTAETYIAALKSFIRFRDGVDIMLDSVTSEVLEEYQAYLSLRGLIPNSISFYMRILRAVYNRAVENGMIEQAYPFRHVYTGIAKTVKRALPIAAMRKIKALDLSRQPSLDYARDMFLMSFYLRGMSFIDMAFLRKCDLKNGYVVYRRRKTGQRLVIKWTKEMQSIMSKYPDNASDYLLPIVRSPEANERSVYRYMGYRINSNLKEIGRLAGVTVPITLYVARHSWASVAKSKGIPLSVISQGMGHDSETTTQIYLASLDTAIVDKANALIISSL